MGGRAGGHARTHRQTSPADCRARRSRGRPRRSSLGTAPSFQGLGGALGAVVAQEAHDQLASMPSSAPSAAACLVTRRRRRRRALRVSWACGSKNISAWRTPSSTARGGMRGRGRGSLSVPAHIHGRVVDGEEGGQRVELIGRLDVLEVRFPSATPFLFASASLSSGSSMPSRWTCSSALGRPVTNSRVGSAVAS